MGVD
jgi:hypothetical protein